MWIFLSANTVTFFLKPGSPSRNSFTSRLARGVKATGYSTAPINRQMPATCSGGSPRQLTKNLSNRFLLKRFSMRLCDAPR